MMETELTEEMKQEILTLIATPGIEIEDIVKKIEADYDTVIDFLTEEYLMHNFDFGRRLCCRF
ncbi:MAG: hypothetical protein ACFFCI_20565 [Promethearchaeota archaeon]